MGLKIKLDRKSENLRSTPVMLICKTLILLISVGILFFIADFRYIKVCVIWLLIENIFLVYLNFYNRFAFLTSLMLLWFNYSIFIGNYFSHISSSFFEDAYSVYALQGYKIMLLFCVALVLFTPKCQNSVEQKAMTLLSHEKSHMNFLSIAYLVALLFILVFAFGRPDASGERGKPTAIYEYSTIIFIVGYYFFGKNRFYLITASTILGLFIIQNLVYGGRITALQLLFIFFFLFYDGKKIHWMKILPLALILLLLFSAIGEMRSDFSFQNFSLSATFRSLVKDAGTLDTAYSAYYTSLSFIKVESIVSVGQRLQMLGAFLLSMILGGRVPNSNLAQFTLQYYFHYEGGVLPFFGNFYLGYIGVILLAFLVSSYFRLMHHLSGTSHGLKKCIAVYITITAPRWYLYNPSQLIRGVLLLCFVFYATKIAYPILGYKGKLS